MMTATEQAYLVFNEGVSARRVPAPQSGQTQSGYGKRIPVGWMVTHEGREYRVYCAIFSNIGSLYIETRGEKRFIQIW